MIACKYLYEYDQMREILRISKKSLDIFSWSILVLLSLLQLWE